MTSIPPLASIVILRANGVVIGMIAQSSTPKKRHIGAGRGGRRSGTETIGLVIDHDLTGIASRVEGKTTTTTTSVEDVVGKGAGQNGAMATKVTDIAAVVADLAASVRAATAMMERTGRQSLSRQTRMDFRLETSRRQRTTLPALTTTLDLVCQSMRKVDPSIREPTEEL